MTQEEKFFLNLDKLINEKIAESNILLLNREAKIHEYITEVQSIGYYGYEEKTIKDLAGIIFKAIEKRLMLSYDISIIQDEVFTQKFKENEIHTHFITFVPIKEV